MNAPKLTSDPEPVNIAVDVNTDAEETVNTPDRNAYMRDYMRKRRAAKK